MYRNNLTVFFIIYMPNNLTYSKSGVNIRSADKFIKFISKLTSKQNKKKRQNNIGNFGSITKLPSVAEMVSVPLLPLKINPIIHRLF